MPNPISQSKFKQAEFVREVFVISPPPGVGLDDILTRDYWTNVSAKLKPMSRIEVMPMDNTYFAELIVTAAGKNWANVVLRDYVNLNPDIPSEKEELHAEFDVIFRGALAKWSVVRKSDKVVLRDEFQSAEEAERWLDNYKQSE